MKNSIKQKNQKGITLIALVITIIILLILAGVSIATLVGEDGIVNKSKEAKLSTEIANEKDQILAAYSAAKIAKEGETVEATDLNNALIGDNVKANATASTNPGEIKVKFTESQREYIITGDGKIQAENIGGGSSTGTLPSTADTKPFLPEGAIVTNNNLDTGLTIKDKNDNEWVWIEVPKTKAFKLNGQDITFENGKTEPSTKNDYNAIETALHTYTETYRNGTTYEDIWYAKDADETIITEKTASLAPEQKALSNGCGLTYDEYIAKRQKMLKSVYENGGFYIGKYEAGAQDLEADGTHKNPVVIKEGAYPYNYVTCSQAQNLVSNLSTDAEITSSLMFGVQWDLALKHIEEKRFKNEGKKVKRDQIIKDLNKDSSSWGNYRNIKIEAKDIRLPTAKGSINYGIKYEVDLKNGKPADKAILLTTGASNRNSVLNINDLAGNVFEFTLETNSYFGIPCAARGGGYFDGGSDCQSYGRADVTTTDNDSSIGFRPALY